MDRRVFLQLGTLSAGALAWPARRAAAQGAEPHFFLMVNFQGSLDPSYLFDARPLAMTAAGRIQNYLGKDPTAWTGANGVTTLATELTQPLLPFKDRFSVLNGVQMAVTFDGHEQNSNYLVTGNPFGGVGFYADLNHDKAPAPLDFLQLGDMAGVNISNGSAGVTLDADTAKKLTETVKQASAGAEPPVMELVRARFAANGGGDGLFSRGTQHMASGLSGAGSLSKIIASMQFPGTIDKDPVKAALTAVQQYFLTGATRSAVLTLPRNLLLDTHSPAQAAAQPTVYKQVATDIATIFQTLKDTPLDQASGKSLLDATTVMIASEFGRTMYQKGLSMDKTGTDHNPLAAGVLLGGKGIRGGLVIGASDQQWDQGTAQVKAVSGTHKKLDYAEVKAMGQVFDFAALAAKPDVLPDEYDARQYLTIGSVANSIYKLFGVGASHYWTLGRNLPAAATLDGLLT